MAQSYSPARRDVLLGPLASALTSILPWAGTAHAATETAAHAYARVRGSAIGRPTYWLTRGVKYAQTGAELVPLHRFAMLESIVLDRGEDGSYISRTLEGGIPLDLDRDAVAETFRNPLTGETAAATAIKPMTVVYRIAPDGVLTPVPPPNTPPSRNAFSGRIGFRPGEPGEIWVSEEFRSKGAANTLTEVITYMARSEPGADGGETLTVAHKTVSTLRNWTFGGKNAENTNIASVYEGRKYLTVDDAVAQGLAPMFEQVHPGYIATLRTFR